MSENLLTVRTWRPHSNPELVEAQGSDGTYAVVIDPTDAGHAKVADRVAKAAGLDPGATFFEPTSRGWKFSYPL